MTGKTLRFDQQSKKKKKKNRTLIIKKNETNILEIVNSSIVEKKNILDWNQHFWINKAFIFN